MNTPRLPLLVLPFIALAAGAASRSTPQVQPAVQVDVRADSDTVVAGRITQLVMLPLPTPESIKPFRLTACFDLDTLGRPTLLQYNLTKDSTYNKRIRETLDGYQFRPSTLRGVPVRDTICVRASVGY